MNFLSQLRYEVSSLQTRVLVNFEVGIKARFLNGFIMILKMLYMHVKFEVGSLPASWIAKIYQDACVLVLLAFVRLNNCSKMCRY